MDIEVLLAVLNDGWISSIDAAAVPLSNPPASVMAGNEASMRNANSRGRIWFRNRDQRLCIALWVDLSCVIGSQLLQVARPQLADQLLHIRFVRHSLGFSLEGAVQQSFAAAEYQLVNGVENV